MAKKGLGKGIDVLIPQAKEKTKSEKENIRTHQSHPDRWVKDHSGQ